MLKIQPQYLSLANLLKGRLFRIPDYQRAYSWTEHQRSDLFDDIEKTFLREEDDGHFMAAVVCLRRDKKTLGTDEFDILEVVDGQQRLTTLIILLNAIKRGLNIEDKTEKKSATEITELLVKPDADELLLLQTNHDTSQYFANYLRKDEVHDPDTASTVADYEILDAIADCELFVEKWKEAGYSLSELIALLKNRLFFLLHEIDNERAVYTVFEVLNSRGLDVSWLDRLKSILMGAAFDLKNVDHKTLISDLHTTWRQIYSVIGLRQGLSTEALRFAATLRTNTIPNRPLGEQDAVDTLRDQATTAKKIREVASWLSSVTNACDKLAADTRINAVTRIAQARLLATAIHLRQDLRPKQKAKILSKWEKISFRIYGMLRYDARTRVGDYVRLAWRVVNERLSAQAIEDAIGAIGEEFTIEDAVESLKGDDRYNGWENELRYFMSRYEEHLADEQGLNFRNEQWAKIWLTSPAKSIEHIWPQSSAPDEQCHRLGNLVLLPPNLNSKLQDKAPKEKMDAYEKTGLLIAAQVAEVICDEGWKAKQINQREKDLLEWAATEWAD